MTNEKNELAQMLKRHRARGENAVKATASNKCLFTRTPKLLQGNLC